MSFHLEDMSKLRIPLLLVAAGCSLFSSGELNLCCRRGHSHAYVWCTSLSVISQSVNDCTATVQITGAQSDPNDLAIPLGIVCIECVVNGAVVTGDTTFLLQGGLIPVDKATAEGGILVVSDTSVTFNASPAKVLRCVNGGNLREASVSLDGKCVDSS